MSGCPRVKSADLSNSSSIAHTEDGGYYLIQVTERKDVVRLTLNLLCLFKVNPLQALQLYFIFTLFRGIRAPRGSGLHS